MLECPKRKVRERKRNPLTHVDIEKISGSSRTCVQRNLFGEVNRVAEKTIEKRKKTKANRERNENQRKSSTKVGEKKEP